MAKIQIQNQTRAVIPRAPFRQIALAVLGKNYNLNVIFVSSEDIKKFNTIYRNIRKPTDILSFPLDKNQGEIYICPEETRTEAKKFDRTYSNFMAYLFIHGVVHLKGYDHGATMENIETKIRHKFKV